MGHSAAALAHSVDFALISLAQLATSLSEHSSERELGENVAQSVALMAESYV